MNKNRPVTNREAVMRPDTILVTRTDLQGVITYANDAFVEISGFTRKELIGAHHNIVRHPDMPAAAFEDLWRTIRAGKPWTAPVKNRTKDGGYYWVEANVVPVFNKGKLQGFLSVRYAPSRESVRGAEELYAELNRGKSSIRPTGFKAFSKKVMEMSLWKKAMVVYVMMLMPAIHGIWMDYLEGNHLGIGYWTVDLFLAALIGRFMVKNVANGIEEALGVFYQLMDGNFRNRIDIDRNDEIGNLKCGLYNMQVKLNAELAHSSEVTHEMTRLKQALDNVQSCVMVANNNNDIIYLNSTVKEMFKAAESDIRTQIPHFDADKLLGVNIDQFHRNPAHQQSLLSRLSSTFRSSMVIGGHHMTIVANPVTNDGGEKIGVVVEWQDRTNEALIEQEIADIVDSVKHGELARRIDLDGKEGFFAKLSCGINELADTIETAFADIESSVKSISAGDLNNRITNDYQGVYLSCKNNINATIDKLSDTVGKINESARYIRNAAQEIAEGNNNLSQRAEQQAASLEETAASMEQLTGTVKANADNAKLANEITNNAQLLAEKGGVVVKSAVEAMREINDSSNRIADIIGVIDEIAFQTNLLALNASVEAARAGDQGRGFSVVATEVRNLAQRSAIAAKESKELIQSSVQKVRSGSDFVNQTGQALNEIVNGVKKVSDIISSIAIASVEQSAGIAQVNVAVAQMDEITQHNAALAEEASAASMSMSELSTGMVDLLDFFKTGVEMPEMQEKKLPGKAQSSLQAKPLKAADPFVFNEEDWQNF